MGLRSRREEIQALEVCVYQRCITLLTYFSTSIANRGTYRNGAEI